MVKSRSLSAHRHCQVILMQVAFRHTSRNSDLGVPRPQKKKLYSKTSQTHTEKWLQRTKLELLPRPSLQFHYIFLLAAAYLFLLSEKKKYIYIYISQQKKTLGPLLQPPQSTLHIVMDSKIESKSTNVHHHLSVIDRICHSLCKHHLHQVMQFSSSRSTYKVGKHYVEKIPCGSLRRII